MILTFVYTIYFRLTCTTSLSLRSELNQKAFFFNFLYIVIFIMKYFLHVKAYRDDSYG